MRFLMQYRTVVQLACQTHKAQPSGIYAMQTPSLKAHSLCTVELQPSPLMLAILLRAAFCFELQLAPANFYSSRQLALAWVKLGLFVLGDL